MMIADFISAYQKRSAATDTAFSFIPFYIARKRLETPSDLYKLFILFIREIMLFDLSLTLAPDKHAFTVIQSELFVNRCDMIHIDNIAPVASQKT